MIIAADYPFLEIFGTMVLFFIWMAWIWTLVMVLSDVFRADYSGWTKALWTIFMVFLPFLGVFVYLIAHGKDMGERRFHDVEMAMSRGHERYTPNGSGSGAASEIANAKQLLDSGAIDQAEFALLKQKALA